MLGCLLFLAARAWRERAWRREAQRALWMGIPYALLGGLTAGLFLILAPNFLSAVVGHHLRQGSQLTAWQVTLKALKLFWDYSRAQPILMALAVLGALRSFRGSHPLASIFVWQVPTALGFLLLSRDLQGRHLVYLVPSLAVLVAIGLEGLWGSKRPDWRGLAWRSTLVVLLLGAALYPSWRENRRVASQWERDTQRLASYIQAHTAPDDYVLSDYPGLNFFARRRTTPLAAGISRGAAKSGQIMGRDLIGEIEAYGVQMVMLNVAQGAHQLVNLRDYGALKQYVQTHFYLAGRTTHDYRLLEIYHRQDLWPGEIVEVNFGDKLQLSGLQWMRDGAPPGDELQVEMRWQSIQPMEADYLVTLALRDEAYHLWGLGSKQLSDVDAQTFWDERGLEQAVSIPTSQWPVAEATVQTFELPVDLATPPGRYTVLARVHPTGLWDGLPILGDGEVASGFDYPLGEVEVLPAPQPPALEAPPEPAEGGADVRFGDNGPLRPLEIVRPHEADLGAGIRLLGWDVSTTDARPGDRLHLSLHWEAQQPVPADYTVRLWLIDGLGQFGGDVQGAPVGAQYPTSQWRTGEILRGQYDLTVDAATPAGTYSLMVSLLDGMGERLADADARFSDNGPLRPLDVELGTIAVSGRQRLFELPAAIQHPVQAELGGLARLLGYDLPQKELMPGDGLPLTLYWQSMRRSDTSYTVFTHLLDERGRLWGQQDNVPLQGTYPTAGWLPGEVVVDPYQIPLRDDAPSGSYRIEMGLYDAAMGIRLPVVDPTSQTLLGDHFLLPEGITVRARP